MVDRISSNPPIYPQGPHGLGSPDPALPLAEQMSSGLQKLTQAFQGGDLEQIAETIKTLHTLSEQALRC